MEHARRVSLQIEMRRHAVHGVDHRAELRHEEGVHHAGRGQGKTDRNACRDDEPVDARHALFGIDEQPFPIERNDLNLQRVGVRRKGPGRIEFVRTDPGDAAEEHHHERGDRPDDELDTARIGPVRKIAGLGVGGTVPPGKRQYGDDHRHDDHQHDTKGIQEDQPLAGSDRALRIKNAAGTAAGHQRRKSPEQQGGPAPDAAVEPWKQLFAATIRRPMIQSSAAARTGHVIYPRQEVRDDSTLNGLATGG